MLEAESFPELLSRFMIIRAGFPKRPASGATFFSITATQALDFVENELPISKNGYSVLSKAVPDSNLY